MTEDAQDRDDTHAWINASKKKEQELVEKRRRQQEEMDRELQESARQYTSGMLAMNFTYFRVLTWGL